VVLLQQRMEMKEGPGAIEWIGLAPNATVPTGNDTAIISTVHDEEGGLISEHMVQLVRPKEIVVPVATLTLKVADSPNADGTIDIAVKSNKVALWVTLTTRAQGRFSNNAFFLPATTKTVQFIPFSPSTASNDYAVLSASVRVEDYSMYRSLPPAPPAPPTPPPPGGAYVEVAADTTCVAQGIQPVTESDCGHACQALGFSFTGDRARANISGCFVMASGPYEGNCNYNTNASATCTPPCTLMGSAVRSVCKRPPTLPFV
jgi:hypothetical protein